MKHEEEKKMSEEEKKDYVEKVQEKLEDIDRQIDDKQKELEASRGEWKQKLRRELDEMKLTREQARKKYAEVKAAGADTWKNVKKYMDASLSDLKKFRERVFHK